MVQAMKISWHELPRGDKPAFDSLVDAICPVHLGLPDVLWAIRPMPRKLYRKPCCVCGLTRRAGDAPPRSASGSIGWSFIYVLTANGALRLRALKGAPEPADPRPDPLRELESGELEHRLASTISGLPERQRAALVLTYHEGLPNAETAAVLGTSVSGVETLLVRARRSLRKTLGPMVVDLK
jgi:RNA polymerase sigma factor (sigma-70 family)